DRPVEGPKVPHLFRSSTEAPQEDPFHLSMSPLTPAIPPQRPETAFKVPPLPMVPTSPGTRPLSSLTDAVALLDKAEVRNWTPKQVAAWMRDAGFEDSIVEKFQENEIAGDILVDLKFEDLRQLDIKSFGKRN